MQNDGIDYEKLRRNVDKSVRRKVYYFGHVAIYLVLNSMAWATWIFGRWGRGGPWEVTVPLTFFLAIHTVIVGMGWLAQRMSDAEFDRAVEREQKRLAMLNMQDKVKRG